MKIRRTLHALLGWSLVVGAAVVAVPGAPSVVHAAGLGGGGEYHALTPTRIFDSRPAPDSLNDVAPLGKKPTTPGAGSGFDIQITGLGGVPNDGTVLAVVASITVVGPTREGFLGAYPAGSPSTNSIINFKAGQTMPNLAILRPGNGGKVTIVLSSSPTAGTADVFVDVAGYFTTSAGSVGARLIPVDNPGRIFDNRPAGLGAGQEVAVPIRGADATNPTQTDIVPNDPSVVGVLVNITATDITGNTYISAVPDAPTSPPTTSNINVLPGQTKANMVLVPVGSDGRIHLYNDQGRAGLIVDVMAYLRTGMDPNTRAGRVVPLDSPFRVFDTRQPQWGQAALGPGQAEDWSFADFVAHVNIGATWVGNQSALIGNLTIAEAKRQYPTVSVNGGYLTAYPSTASRPLISNLNSVEGASVPNMALMRYGTNSVVRIYNSLGYTHYILDVSAVVLSD